MVAALLFIFPNALSRWIKKKYWSVITEEIETSITLVQFAQKQKLFLDQSRKEFLERHDLLIDELVKGKLRGRNRFRELLLGVKSVGKSELCKILNSYTKEMHPQVLTVYISYDSCDTLLSDRICQQIAVQKHVRQSEIRVILSLTEAQQRIEKLELFLEANNIRLFLLVDEFHFVYNKPVNIGEEIVKEMSVISGTSLGYIHCILTGSSSCLRALVFAKLEPEKEAEYKSYGRKVDLNSTKLQPKWIFPITEAKDFCELLEMRGIEVDDDVAKRFFFSGGRPGLAIEPPKYDDIPYYLGAKYLCSENSPLVIVLQCIFDCMDSFKTDATVDDDEITSLERDLTLILDHDLWGRVGEKNVEIDAQSFEQILFRLADDGVIIFRHAAHMRQISISCNYVYFQLRQSRKISSLTWKEYAALKMPTGYFCGIAEEVAFRFIKAKSLSLFNTNLNRYDCTSLNFGQSAKTSGSTFALDSDFQDISYCIHKELVDGKDKAGAHGVLLENGNGGVRLSRLQLKLGQSKMVSSEVNAIKMDMFRRGQTIVSSLESKGYIIVEYVCYLITTRYVETLPENESSDSESSKCNDYSSFFKILGPKELSNAQVWSDEVKSMGMPYASNKKIDYNRILA